MKSETEKPKFWLFQTFFLVMTVLLYITPSIWGISEILRNNYWGVIVCTLAVTIFVCGLKNHSPQPLTFGVVTVWGRIWSSDGIVVSGKVPLFPWFPLYIDTIDINMTAQSIDVEIGNAVSVDHVKMSGKVTFTVRVDSGDIADFISIGSMIGVKDNIKNPVAQVVEKLCAAEPWMRIQQRSIDFETDLKKMIDSGPYGVRVEHIQVQLSAPQDLLAAITEEEKEKAQKITENMEFTTNMEAAKALRSELVASTQPGEKIPTLKECLDMVIEQKVRMGGGMQVVKGGKPVVVTK